LLIPCFSPPPTRSASLYRRGFPGRLPTAVGKKNWLFIGAPEAGFKAATFYSLLGSSIRRGLNPRDYLIWLFARLPTATNRTAANLTPAAFAKLQAGTAASPRLAQPAA
jgi:hypothetical protein